MSSEAAPTFGSLFAGIGGIDLGLERAGWRGAWQVEWNGFCQHVLEHHWPDIPRWGDITTVDWSAVPPVDLLAGGFPCQPVSMAGNRLGEADERWLWPEYARAIRALRPRLVLVENVPGLLAGHGGMGRVLGDLAELGYDAEWDSVPAAAVGAPHLRYRVWIVAYADTDAERWAGRPRVFGAGWRRQLADGGPPLADPDDTGLAGRRSERGLPEGSGEGEAGRGGILPDAAGVGQPRPRPYRDGGDGSTNRHRQAAEPLGGGFTDQWLVEPDVGRVAHGVPARVDRLSALGNAVVPQVVELIGRALLDLHEGEMR